MFLGLGSEVNTNVNMEFNWYIDLGIYFNLVLLISFSILKKIV